METTKNILIVDDDELLLELLTFKLRFEGYAVTAANSGEAALQSLAKEIPDAIILDGMLGGIDGVEVLKNIRGTAQTARIPIMMLSGRQMEADVIQALEFGADEYLTKPVMLDVLLMRLKMMLKRAHAQV